LKLNQTLSHQIKNNDEIPNPQRRMT